MVWREGCWIEGSIPILSLPRVPWSTKRWKGATRTASVTSQVLIGRVWTHSKGNNVAIKALLTCLWRYSIGKCLLRARSRWHMSDSWTRIASMSWPWPSSASSSNYTVWTANIRAGVRGDSACGIALDPSFHRGCIKFINSPWIVLITHVFLHVPFQWAICVTRVSQSPFVANYFTIIGNHLFCPCLCSPFSPLSGVAEKIDFVVFFIVVVCAYGMKHKHVRNMEITRELGFGCIELTWCLYWHIASCLDERSRLQRIHFRGCFRLDLVDSVSEVLIQISEVLVVFHQVWND